MVRTQKAEFSRSPYVVDFNCIEAKIIIEIDGGQHSGPRQYDERRTRFLESRGFKMLRFWNNDVLNKIEGGLDALTLAPLPEGEGPEQKK
jgi:very-short-patch-repair endonuclease